MRSLLTAFSLVSVLAGCGANLTPQTQYKAVPLEGGDCLRWGTAVSMSNYAGHVVPEVPIDDIKAGVAKDYLLGAGRAGHVHILPLSVREFAKLKANFGIEVATATDETHHTHSVVINCNMEYVGNGTGAF